MGFRAEAGPGPAVHVIGLQRSGTNFVASVVAANTNAAVLPSGDRSVFWKHALPWEKVGKAEPPVNPITAIADRPDLRILFVTKHPLTWWESVSRRNGQDFFQKRPGCRAADGGPDLAACCLFYNAFNGGWLRLADGTGIIHVRYEDVLQDPDAFLTAFAQTVGAARRKRLVTVHRVPLNKGFDAGRRQYYLDSATELGPEEKARAAVLIDSGLAASLGYAPL